MEAKHTPGPWKADIRIGCIAVYPESINHNCLAIGSENFIAYWHGFKDEDGWNVKQEDEANAKLIASAPELLEALIDFVHSYRDLEGVLDEPMEAIVKRGKEVINKATS